MDARHREQGPASGGWMCRSRCVVARPLSPIANGQQRSQSANSLLARLLNWAGWNRRLLLFNLSSFSRVLLCTSPRGLFASLPMLARLASRSGCTRATPALLLSSPANTSSRLVPQRTLSSTASPPPPSRLRRYAVRTVLAALGLGVAYELDKEYHASAIIRNVRTLWTVSKPIVFFYTPISLRVI